MIHLVCALLATARSSLKSKRELALENLALRQRLAVLRRTTKRPKLTNADRAFWVALSRLWPDWQHVVILVRPETLVGWHRKGFKLYWTWKSRSRFPVLVGRHLGMLNGSGLSGNDYSVLAIRLSRVGTKFAEGGPAWRPVPVARTRV